MTKIDATTPQSKVVKRWADVLASRDLNNAEPILSKDFVFKAFPKAAELPDLTREEYIQKYGAILSLLAKVEVRIQHRTIAPELSADMRKPSGQLPRGDRSTRESCHPCSSHSTSSLSL